MLILTFQKNVTIYKILHKGSRCEYFPIGGCFNPNEELTRIIAKDIVYLSSNTHYELLFESLYQKLFSRNEIKDWVDQEKKNIFQVLKFVLNCLRSIGQIKSKQNQSEAFIKHLNLLLGFCQQNSIASFPVILFSAHIESLSTQNRNSNIEMVENELFSLKSNLQKIFKFMNSLVEKEKLLDLSRPRGGVAKNKLQGTYGTIEKRNPRRAAEY